MARPIRLTLSRRKGFQLQAFSRQTNGLDAVVVARPSRWGNPFVIGRDGTQAECVQRYRVWLAAPDQAALREHAAGALRGKNIACWCIRGSACHGDVLLELANGSGPENRT